MIESSEESEIERKIVKGISVVTVTSETIYDRNVSWMKRLLTSCKKQQVLIPLTSSEIENKREFHIKKEQHRYSKCEKFELSRHQLNLKLNQEGLYKCYGGIQGEHPIFVPKKSKLAEKSVEEGYIQTIYGGATLTVAKVKSKYWVSTLRQLVKRVLRQCYRCKKFHVRSYPVPQKGVLPAHRENLDS